MSDFTANFFWVRLWEVSNFSIFSRKYSFLLSASMKLLYSVGSYFVVLFIKFWTPVTHLSGRIAFCTPKWQADKRVT